MSKAELQHAPQALTVPGQSLIQQAIDKGMTGEQLNGLLEFSKNLKYEAAKEAYFQSFQTFKNAVPKILKKSEIKHGDKLIGKYAKLEDVCEALIPALGAVNITHRWTSEVVNQLISVTCYLRHEMGYEEKGASLIAAPDTGPARNAVQSVGSTMTYLQRYTLLASCGIAPEGVDNDGAPRMDEGEVGDWISGLEGAVSLVVLKQVFGDAYKAAKASGDMNAQKKIVAVYEDAKRAFLEGQ